MKKHILTLLILVIVPLLTSCTKRDLSERVDTSATITVECKETIDISDTRMMLFDSEGYYVSDIIADKDLPATFQVLSGIHTVAAFINAEHYNVEPSDLVIGRTHISGIVAAQKTDAPENPFFWFGHSKANLHPAAQTSVTVQINKTAALGIGITVTPWTVREMDIDL